MYCDFPVVGRCCFCMPLRRGILTLGYINIFLSLFMIGVFSYAESISSSGVVFYHGAKASLPGALCIVLHCLDLIFNGVLVYGAHKGLMKLIRIYYYFSISTIVASVLIQIIELILASTDDHEPFAMPMSRRVFFIIEGIPLLLLLILTQVYLIILVRSLLWKLDRVGPGMYENPLQQIVYNGGVDNKAVYETTVEAVNV